MLDLYRTHDLPVDQMRPRLEAIKQFRALVEAASLIEANKRSRNIVAKEKVSGHTRPVASSLLHEPSEQALYSALAAVEPLVEARMEQKQFAEALRALARLRDPVDRFFTDVRVVVPDETLRNNRFALLNRLNDLLNRVANISRLPA